MNYIILIIQCLIKNIDIVVGLQYGDEGKGECIKSTEIINMIIV